MATTTPNYGWDVPTSTDYVKDGATAIETLGDDIDASLFSITSGKNVGLVHISTTSISASASTVITSCFSSTFENYRVVITGFGSTNQDLFVRMASASTPDAGANYQYQTIKGGGAVVTGSSTTTQTRFESIAYLSSGLTSAILEIGAPNLATATSYQASGGRYDQLWLESGQLNTSTQYDSFNIFAGSGTFTGTVRIYGYRNS
jgi:hypothetical protein